MSIPLQTHFHPDEKRARQMNDGMQAGLGESLEHITDQCRNKLPFDEQRISAIITDLDRGKSYPPSTFAIYYELAAALFGDDYETAEKRFQELAKEQPRHARLQIMALGDPEILAHTPRYQRVMNSDPLAHFDFLPPPAELSNAFRKKFANGLALVERCIPELAEEVHALISQVLMAVGDPESGMEFDGGSSYSLWGALFLNATCHENDIAMAEVIAHETAHCLLYGMSIDESLVLNPDDELFPSPLRRDKRPMDGIYHATFVSARMHWAMSRLIESGQLDAQAHKTAEQACHEDQVNFYSGYETVAAHAQLTETGKQVMAGAKAYMDAACADKLATPPV
jgi:hypothetical protein